MLNKVKTKALISVGAVAATSFILMMGYTAGQHSTAKQSRKEIELAAAKLVENKQAEDKASIFVIGYCKRIFDTVLYERKARRK